MKIVLIGGYPKGFDEPFHLKTVSGRILRNIVSDLEISPVYFDLWNNKEEEDSRIINTKTKDLLFKYIKQEYVLISLGRYIEKALNDNLIKTEYLPHPASRDKKYIEILKKGLKMKRDEYGLR